MTYATTFLFFSFIAELLLTAYYFWTANEITKPNVSTPKGKFDALGSMAEGWKKSLFLFVAALVIFFIYYGSLMVTVIDVTNIYDATGAIDTTIKTEDWRLGWEFLKIMIALVFVDFGLLVWRIMNQTRLLVSVFGDNAEGSRRWKQR